MNTVDYIYRFNPRNPAVKPPPRDPASARRTLEEGNRTFARWMQSCRSVATAGSVPPYVLPCNDLEVGMNSAPGEPPRQAPFAVVVGCSDARVPTEMLFGQGFNDLFVIRVAGNVLGDVCMGSVQFALKALHQSVRCLVILGHLGCGAVTSAVDCYLDPQEFWSESTPPMLRTITERIFVAVREADEALKECWGSGARGMPGYRAALLDMAVCLNAAHAAFALREAVAAAGRREMEVLHGVYNLRNHQVSMPAHPHSGFAPETVNLAPSPDHPRAFRDLAGRMAELYRSRTTNEPSSGGHRPQGSASPEARGADLLGRELGTPAIDSTESRRDLIGREIPGRPL